MLRILYASDSLETILSHLSMKVMDIIINRVCYQELKYLLAFLAAWEERPMCLTPIAYQWCSAISEAAGAHKLGNLSSQTGLPKHPRGLDDPALIEIRNQHRLTEGGFSEVGRDCDSFRFGDTSHDVHRHRQQWTPNPYSLLSTVLKIGFRLVTPGRDKPTFHLNHTSHHDQMFETAFSIGNDKVIADAVSAWIVASDRASPGSCVHYLVRRLAQRMRSDVPFFTPPLRWASINVIELIQLSELRALGPGIVQLLNHLNVGVDDMVERSVWAQLLAEVICLPAGLESLSSHYWCLLDNLTSGVMCSWTHELCDVVMVMGLLEKAEDWEKLEIWMVIVWQSLPIWKPTPMGDIEQVTLKLLTRRASALPRYKALCQYGVSFSRVPELQHICDQAQAEQSRYVSAYSARYLSVLTLVVPSPQSTDSRPIARSTSLCRRRHFLKVFIVFIVGMYF